MLIIQYPIQWTYIYSSVDFLEILATHVQHGFDQANGGSINTTRVHAFQALLLPSKHYQL